MNIRSPSKAAPLRSTGYHGCDSACPSFLLSSPTDRRPDCRTPPPSPACCCLPLFKASRVHRSCHLQWVFNNVVICQRASQCGWPKCLICATATLPSFVGGAGAGLFKPSCATLRSVGSQVLHRYTFAISILFIDLVKLSLFRAGLKLCSGSNQTQARLFSTTPESAPAMAVCCTRRLCTSKRHHPEVATDPEVALVAVVEPKKAPAPHCPGLRLSSQSTGL